MVDIEQSQPGKRRPAPKRRAFGPVALLGIAVLPVLALFAFAGGTIWRHDYRDIRFDRYAPPSRDHPFGTDGLGADMVAQIIRGTRNSLLVALPAAAAMAAVGIALAVLAGRLRRNGRSGIAWLVDLVLVAAMVEMFAILFDDAILFINVRYRPTTWLMLSPMLVMVAWLAAVTALRAVRRRMPPDTSDLVVASVTLVTCLAVLYEARYAFTGSRLRPPETSLGLLLEMSRNELDPHPWLFVMPYAFVVVIPLAVYFFAVGVRHAAGHINRRRAPGTPQEPTAPAS